jgi:hypothetical protein
MRLRGGRDLVAKIRSDVYGSLGGRAISLLGASDSVPVSSALVDPNGKLTLENDS